ncbi:hypothetical protein [Nocardioides ferulae]|uniref:hypothetical protein n=1 Tax=Nocardioides ferulae TaxID=2340821 RepID=UPI000EAE7BAE|nr:hypothetical protein [Nocardioides ferulae]
MASSGLLLIVLFGISGLLGGWSQATPDGIREVAAGETVEADPFRIRLDEARVERRFGDSRAEKGTAFLVLAGRLELTGDEPVGVGAMGDLWSVELPGARDVYGGDASKVPPPFLVAGDGSTLVGMGPGLEYDVQLVHVLDLADLPSELTVTIHEHGWRRSSLDRAWGWHDPVPAARVRLDVTPLPEPGADEAEGATG